MSGNATLRTAVRSVRINMGYFIYINISMLFNVNVNISSKLNSILFFTSHETLNLAKMKQRITFVMRG